MTKILLLEFLRYVRDFILFVLYKVIRDIWIQLYTLLTKGTATYLLFLLVSKIAHFLTNMNLLDIFKQFFR